eukprot:TRINITY_DN95609_c0_g1_i1.p1 TRINITY_DN95609_c0_g1~~TRINITY_DN95609_c0_g1_i1.p1  ORF type:complete len:228 (+),score=74.05 TRINITY_DN95609_c0_g1_i1:62-685(+)
MPPPTPFQKLLMAGNNEEAILESLKEDLRGRDPLEDAATAGAHQRDKDWWTPLHWAAYYGYSKLTEKLIELRVDINAPDLCGATPLMIAAFNGKLNIVEALLQQRHLKVTEGNNYNSTALHYAAQRGHDQIIEVLVQKKSEVDALDKASDTPLSWAARSGYKEAVVKLLELRADPQLDNNASEDAIEMAELFGEWEIKHILEIACDD